MHNMLFMCIHIHNCFNTRLLPSYTFRIHFAHTQRLSAVLPLVDAIPFLHVEASSRNFEREHPETCCLMRTRYAWFERHDIVQVGPRPYIKRSSSKSHHHIQGAPPRGIFNNTLFSLSRGAKRCLLTKFTKKDKS